MHQNDCPRQVKYPIQMQLVSTIYAYHLNKTFRTKRENKSPHQGKQARW